MMSMTVAAAVAAAPGPSVLAARGSWAALRFAARCQAAARPLPPASTREPQARAGFSFGQGRHGAFFVRLSRTPRSASSVLLTIGERPFLLAARAGWGWSRDAAQDAAILAAVRTARSMRIESRDSGGRRFIDRYLLDGAPTAIDAAAAGCAGKI